jgi:hypothetical protein
VQLYFIPTYVIFALWISRGVAALLGLVVAFGRLGRGSPRIAGAAAFAAVSGALLLLPLIGVRETYAANDWSKNYTAARTLDTVAQNAERNATVLHMRSPLWYMVIVEKRRRDLTLVDPFQPVQPGKYNDVVWPADLGPKESSRIYGTGGNNGVGAARKAAERGPVYLLADPYMNLGPLREAGFQTKLIGNDFYKLIPPGGAGA